MRGYNADIIVCDEICFMKQATLLKAVFPVLQQNATCLLGTTTPSGSDHIVSRMITVLDDDGLPVIATVRIGKPCDECSAQRIFCTHVENAVAEGTSRKKRNKYQKLYEGGQEHIAMREFQGEIGDDSMQIFQRSWLVKLREKELTPVPASIDMLFITCDPAQGGVCEWSTIACYFDRIIGEMVIVLLDAFCIQPATPQNIKEHFERSINTLISSHPMFAHTPIVIACESAPKMFAEAIGEYALCISKTCAIDVTVMREMRCVKGVAGVGVPKDAVNTVHMVDMTKVFLENNAISFSSVCCTSCREKGATVETQKVKLISQLERVKKKRKESTDPFSTPRIRIDGKEGGQNDDYAVAFMMQAYWYSWFWQSTNELYADVRAFSSSRRGYTHQPGSTHVFTPKAFEGKINNPTLAKRKRSAPHDTEETETRKKHTEKLTQLLNTLL